jgi:hypothetical protein
MPCTWATGQVTAVVALDDTGPWLLAVPVAVFGKMVQLAVVVALVTWTEALALAAMSPSAQVSVCAPDEAVLMAHVPGPL